MYILFVIHLMIFTVVAVAMVVHHGDSSQCLAGNVYIGYGEHRDISIRNDLQIKVGIQHQPTTIFLLHRHARLHNYELETAFITN